MVVRQICGTNVSASKKKHKLLLSYVHYSVTLNLTSWRLVLLLPGRHGSCHHNHYIYIFPLVFSNSHITGHMLQNWSVSRFCNQIFEVPR